ncbi:MAG TPA: hypothetical protein VMJ10_12655 [Kofleriaceae bacterium]|nr:hypothetical protein [Kofleriaceae bacterium]
MVASDPDPRWFASLVEDLARRKKLRPKILLDGPVEFHAQIGMRHNKPLYELRADLAKDCASYRDTDVPYGEVVRVYRAGMMEQFSPFDDNTTAFPTSLKLRAWLAKQCR